MEKNAKEGSARRFILVQLPEAVADQDYSVADICKKRLRVASESFAAIDQVATSFDSKCSLGFKAFSLSASSLIPWQASFDNLQSSLLQTVENIRPDRSELDVLYEILLKYGLDLAVAIESRDIAGRMVYIIGAGALIVCLAEGITLDLVEGIAALKTELEPEIMRVVFKDAGFPDDVVKTNTVQILRQARIDDVKSL